MLTTKANHIWFALFFEENYLYIDKVASINLAIG